MKHCKHCDNYYPDRHEDVCPVCGGALKKASVEELPMCFEGLYFEVDEGYTNYIRFYPDGTVISVSAVGSPRKVAKWLRIEERGEDSFSEGEYRLEKGNIFFKVTCHAGTVGYSGFFNGYDCLVVKSHSFINGHNDKLVYQFFCIDSE